MTRPVSLEKLFDAARAVQKNAYAPYSKFNVGAALLSADGRIYRGCNVENASYGLTMCAERSALASAISDGVDRFSAIAIVTPAATPCPPCGMCLQTLSEFGKELKIYLITDDAEQETSLTNLLPNIFDKDYL